MGETCFMMEENDASSEDSEWSSKSSSPITSSSSFSSLSQLEPVEKVSRTGSLLDRRLANAERFCSVVALSLPASKESFAEPIDFAGPKGGDCFCGLDMVAVGFLSCSIMNERHTRKEKKKRKEKEKEKGQSSCLSFLSVVFWLPLGLSFFCPSSPCICLGFGGKQTKERRKRLLLGQPKHSLSFLFLFLLW